MGDSAHALLRISQLSLAFLMLLIFAVGRNLDLFALLILLLVLLARRMFLPQGGKVPQCRRALQGATLELINGVATGAAAPEPAVL